MEGWVDIGERFQTEMVYLPLEGRPLSTNLAAQGLELNSQLVDYKSDALTTTPPSHFNTTEYKLFIMDEVKK